LIIGKKIINLNLYEAIGISRESTVVAEYLPDDNKESAFQTEDQLEKAFIQQLQSQAYEYLPITSSDELTSNLRFQLEKLNNFKFTASEWNNFLKIKIASNNDGIVEKTARIQEVFFIF